MALHPTFNSIWITTSFIGFHRFPNPPQEVAYLDHVHRHKFNVKVVIEVFHNEREIEFHMFKTFVCEVIDQKINLNSVNSCESMSDIIAEAVNERYPNREIAIFIDEDGENGSYKQYIPAEDWEYND